MSQYLYDYQKKAIEFLEANRKRDIKGSILSLKMGLGKTLISLVFSQRFEKTLIVCEKSNIQTWIGEIKKFLPEDTEYIVLHSDFVKTPKKKRLDNYSIVITTFEFVASCFDDGVRCYIVKIPQIGKDGAIQDGVWTENDIEANNSDEKKSMVKKHMLVKNKTLESEESNNITSRKWNLIVADEVNKIVNYNTKNSRSVSSLVSDYYLILSGSPMINYSHDLYSLFRFLGLEITPKEFDINYFKRNNLISYIYFLTYEQAGVKLPELREHIVNVKLTDDEKRLQKIIIDELSKEYRQFIRGLQKFSAPLRMFLHLRMSLTYPYMLNEGQSEISYIKDHPDIYEKIQDRKFIGSKMKSVVEQIKELKGKRILIFSQFVKCLKRIKSEIIKSDNEYLSNLRVAVLSGEVDTEERIGLVNMLNNGDLDILLIQIKVGSSGLNIQKADVVFIVEPFYNTSTENQAIHRAYRTGRDKPVDVYRFLVEDSFEYYILKIQNRKEQEKVKFLGGENLLEKSFTTDVIDFIVSSRSNWNMY